MDVSLRQKPKLDRAASQELLRTMPVTVVILPQNGDEGRTQRTTALAVGATATGDAIAKILRKKKAAELIGAWKAKGGQLQLWSWRDGKAGTENKHELPPPHDEVLLFGDAVVVLVTGAGVADFTAESWATFYDEAFGGFEDIGEKGSAGGDDEDEEEEGDDEDEDGDAEEEEEEGDEGDEDGEAEEEEEEEGEEEDGDCYEEGEEGGGKRRSVRRRTTADTEYRRVEMGLRARLKMPTPPTKRAPRWQTGAELEAEPY